MSDRPPPPARPRKSLPPPPPSSQSSPPRPPGRQNNHGGANADDLLTKAAGVHARQKGWNQWIRVCWWLVLPVAVFCWAAALRSGWPRRFGLVLAALIGLVGVDAVLSSDENSTVESQQSVETLDEDTDSEPTPSTSQPSPAGTNTTPAATTPSTSTVTPSVAVEALIAALEAGGDGNSPAAISLLSQLEALIGDPDPNRPRYDRDAFFERADLDGDCVDTRHEILQEEAIEYTMSLNGCSVTVGVWYDPFTGQTFTNPGDLQVDHVVALGDAWASGAWAWSDAQRKAFSNHPANLNVIHGPENQAKSDKGPARYTPSNPAQTCSYLVQYGSVKTAWSMTISQADFDAIAAGLNKCDEVAAAAAVSIAATPTSTTTAPPPTTTTQDCHPAYDPCLPNLAGNAINCGDLPSSQKPVTVINPGIDPYQLDGDNDGVGCEGG